MPIQPVEPKSLFLHTTATSPAQGKRPSSIYEPPPLPKTEPWVDLKTVARHIGFSYQTALKMVHRGELPSTPKANGARIHRRFRLSEVDEALRNSGGHPLPAAPATP